MSSVKSMHIELFKETDGDGNPSAYCFAFVDLEGKVHFASFEHGKFDREYMDKIATRGNSIFGFKKTQPIDGIKWWEKIRVYTNIPEVHKEGRRKLLEVTELDEVTKFIRGYTPPIDVL